MPGASAERDDADLGVQEQVDRDALLGRAAVQAEDLPVAADEPVTPPPVTRPSADPRSEWMMSPVLTGSPMHVLAERDLALVQVAEVVARDVDRRDAGPARVDRLLGEVLLGA